MAKATQSIYEDGTYLAAQPDWHCEDSPWKAAQAARMLRKHNVAFGSLADVGCGAGGVLDCLSREFPDARLAGFDVSPDASSFWRAHQNRVEYRQADFLALDERFDVLLLLDVFEHIEDYLGFLKRLSGRAEFFLFHIPLDISLLGLLRGLPLRFRAEVGHLHYFWKESALATLKDGGYQVVDWAYTHHSEVLPQDKLLTKAVTFLRKALFRVSPDLSALILGGFSMMVLATPAAKSSAIKK